MTHEAQTKTLSSLKNVNIPKDSFFFKANCVKCQVNERLEGV